MKISSKTKASKSLFLHCLRDKKTTKQQTKEQSETKKLQQFGTVWPPNVQNITRSWRFHNNSSLLVLLETVRHIMNMFYFQDFFTRKKT